MRRDGYSRRVRALKVLLPVASVMVVLAVFLFPRSLLIDAVGLSGVSFDPSEGLRLLSPDFSGTTEAGEPFSLRAAWALPDAPDPAHIALGDLEGEIALGNGETVRLTAQEGDFFPKNETLALRDAVTVRSDSGYVLSVSTANVDLAAETLRASGPVEGSGDAGRISADSMRMERRDGTLYIWFEGDVKVTVMPGSATLP